jgi:hypothetical protein
VRWENFVAECPELAALGEARLKERDLCFVGTLRKNGWPRISPCEPELTAGHLLLGMMWRSPKALDLLRDPRCAVHSCTTDREGTEGDFKLYGTAADIREPELREAYREAIYARIGWAPDEPNFHLFAVDIDSAGFVIFGTERYGLAWDPQGGLRRWSIPDD